MGEMWKRRYGREEKWNIGEGICEREEEIGYGREKRR